MERFMGMMPSSEVKKSSFYKDKNGNVIEIQAGDHGWTIMWADGGSTYKDADRPTKENFDEAYYVSEEALGELTSYLEVAEDSYEEYCEDNYEDHEEGQTNSIMYSYIGTKVVRAKPMTRGEYAERSGRKVILTNESKSDEGYFVRYSDGYESWSPKKQFEEAYIRTGNELYETCLLMKSDNYKDRFIVEYKQLSIRIKRLWKMLDKYKNGTLEFTTKCPYLVLHQQLVTMESYQVILETRAEIEGIEI